MKLFAGILLSFIQYNFGYPNDSADYLLRIVEHQVDIQPGVFSCIFYDFSSQLPYDNIMDTVLQSPRLASTVIKIVLNGSYEVRAKHLPVLPSLLVLHPGDDVDYLERNDTKMKFLRLLAMLNPVTKILVLMDSENPRLFYCIVEHMKSIVVTSAAFVDIERFRALIINGIQIGYFPGALHPILFFSKGRYSLEGWNITFAQLHTLNLDWNNRWVKETARYLRTNAMEIKHPCTGSGQALFKCLYQLSLDPDIILYQMTGVLTNFAALDLSVPKFMKIAVPKERLINIAELMLMPLSWQVWTLLMVIFALAEFTSQLFPKLFGNDPILLVVCGYERHDLHQAGRCEKIVLHSLIILMFFINNAFETKMISMMVSRPSLQRIKTLDDLLKSGLKLREDIENNPNYLQYPILSQIMEQGDKPFLSETDRGYGMVLYRELAEVLKDTAYDYERSQPFYILLDLEINDGPEMFITRARYPYLEVFRYTYITLVEAGVMDLWKRQWHRFMRFRYAGRRPRKDANDKVVLVFEDLQPAWLAVAIGLSISAVCFLGELGREWVFPGIFEKCRLVLEKVIQNTKETVEKCQQSAGKQK